MPPKPASVAMSHTTLILSAIVILVGSTLAAGQTETVLHSFGSGTDGGNPIAALVADKAGALFGTTKAGGTFAGTVFESMPPAKKGDPWTYAVIYNFKKEPDGYAPAAGLVFDKSGNLYGTTSNGGSSGHGTVFELMPPAEQGDAWTEVVLYNFAGGSDGSSPFGALIFDGPALVGTTFAGGASDAGTVFELKKVGSTWTESLLYTFTGGSDGGNPDPGVTLYKGVLYGTTKNGGTCCGTIFSLTHPAKGLGAETVLHTFTGGADGYTPQGGVIFDKSGDLYSTTEGGGQSGFGTVFELMPPAEKGGAWTETVLHNFSVNGTDGVNPVAGLIFDSSGALYGTTNGGGQDFFGTVFKLAPPGTKGDPWTETIVHTFAGGTNDGANPEAGLIFFRNVLYGTTNSGGQYNLGTVFEATK